MFNTIFNTISRFFGVFAGALTGAISDMVLRIKYIGDRFSDTGEMNDWSDLFVGIAFGIPSGFVLGLIRGGYKGATEGFLAGLSFPAALYAHYYGVKNKNAELNNYIQDLDSKTPFCPVLNEAEINTFKNYLEEMKNVETKRRLQQTFDEYTKYVNQVCPLTGGKVSEHRDPITVTMVSDNESVEKIYNRQAILEKMRFFAQSNTVGLETPCSNAPFKKEAIVSTRLPSIIADFITEVRKRIKDFFTTQKVARELGLELGLSNTLSIQPEAVAEESSSNVYSISSMPAEEEKQEELEEALLASKHGRLG